MTTADDIRQVNEFCKEVGYVHGASICDIDDYNQHRSFSVVCSLNMSYRNTRSGAYTPADNKVFNLRKLNAHIKKIAKKHNLRLNWIESPKLVYYTSYEQRIKLGYEKAYVMIDIDIR